MIIGKKGMPDMFHMHPYLVGAAGFQFALNDGYVAEALQHFVMRSGIFANLAIGVGGEDLAKALVAAYVGFHAEPTIEGTSVATTRAVVNASLLVLMFNFVMSAFLFQ